MGKAEVQEELNTLAKSLDHWLGEEEQLFDPTEQVNIQRELSGRITDFGPSLVPLSYPDMLRHPRNYSIPVDLAVDLNKYPDSAQVIAAAQRSAPLELGATSIETYYNDFRLTFADFYRRVAGAPLQILPSRTFYFMPMCMATFPLDDVPMDTLSILFFKGEKARELYFLPFFDRLTALSQPSSAAWQSAYSFVQYFGKEIDAAARILATAHPGSLRQNNLRVFLREDLISQQQEMTAEDPWQDRAACIKVGCNQLERMESAYDEYNDKVGVELWGKIRDLPWWAWWLASSSYKYNLARQGLGPAQIIVGLAERAAGQREILQRYSPFLSARDFSSSDDMIRTVLDPKKAIFAKAMVFDYIFTELEKTLFADPNFREPATIAPFISDLRTAREYSLMYLAMRLAIFPEVDFLAAKFISVPLLAHYHVHLLHAADLFNIKLALPGLFYYRWESSDAVVYSEFMFCNPEPIY